MGRFLSSAREARARSVLVAAGLGAALLAAATAGAKPAPPLGALTPLTGSGGCVSAPGKNPGCAHGRVLRGLTDLAISRDGKSVYAVSDDGTNGAVAVFRRDPRTRALTQLPGTAGCVSSDGSAGSCSKGLAMHGTYAVAVSPDGRNVYTASFYGDDDGISVFARNPGTGALTGLPGTSGCVTATGTGGACGKGIELPARGTIAVSPDGKNVYAVAFRSVLVFARDTATGALTQLPAPAGCVSESGSKGSCIDGRGLLDTSTLAVSPDGRNVYVAGGEGDSNTPTGNIAVFRRDPATGALSQSSRPDGCLSETDATCARAASDVEGPAAIAISADGKTVYLGAFGLVTFSRTATTGALKQLHDVNSVDASGLTLSPDSRSVYLTHADTMGVYARARASGALTPLAAPYGCIAQAGPRCTHAKPLEGLGAVAVSADGANVYVVSSLRDAIVAFARRR